MSCPSRSIKRQLNLARRRSMMITNVADNGRGRGMSDADSQFLDVLLLDLME